MTVLIALAALALLMLAAYRGYSVILFAPIAALGAVLLTDPAAVAPAFTGVFMEKMVGFIKLYFPVFLLGAVFGKLIELSGFSRSIVAAAIRLLGTGQAMLVIVLVCALLTYGGVSLFVVVFAVYPFAAEMFRQSNIPKRLIPATIAPYVIEAVGARRARQLFLTANSFDADYAAHAGLIDLVLPQGSVDEFITMLTDSLGGNAPGAMGEAKRLVNDIAGHRIDHGLMDDTARRIARARVSAEGQEGVRAFLDKRKPSWTV